MTVQDLAKSLTDSSSVPVVRIAMITAISSAAGKKVQTDQTGTAWLNRSEDTALGVGDRVWMLQQNTTFIVGGRLSGEPPTGPLVKAKSVTQTVTSSITAVDDNDFGVTLQPGVYRVELVVHFTSASAAADLRSLWRTTGTITVNGRSVFGPAASTADVTSDVFRASGHFGTTAVIYGTDAGLTTGTLREDLLVTVAVAGLLQWQFAQGTSSASGTSVSSASRLYVTPLSTL